MNTFVVAVLVLVLIGIAKDVVASVKFLEKWMRSRGNGDPKAPVSMETLVNLLRAQSEVIGTDIKQSFDVHFDALMAENRKTNDYLYKFLIFQKILAKKTYGIDLDI